MKSKKNQRGNVLWFILIGVVLLGLLSMILSRGGSSVDQTGDYEQRSISISQLLRYAGGVEQAVQQLLMNGCSIDDISFQNTMVAGYGAGSPECRIFESTGQGLSWQNSTGSTATLLGGEGVLFTGSLNVPGIGADAGPDLVMLAAVSEKLCAQINRAQDISGTITTAIDDTAQYDAAFTQTFVIEDDNTGDSGNNFSAHASGCFIDDNSEYIFYHVLAPR